jgi:hypothetical protein
MDFIRSAFSELGMRMHLWYVPINWLLIGSATFMMIAVSTEKTFRPNNANSSVSLSIGHSLAIESRACSIEGSDANVF